MSHFRDPIPVFYLNCKFNLFGAMTANFRNVVDHIPANLKDVHDKIAMMYEGESNILCCK